jgi:uncharacterized protein (DUF488 family)
VGLRIYTIGHSTRPIDELIDLLRPVGVEVLIDIRTIPESRKNPQFGQQSLERSLLAAGIEYRHMKSLGGLRKPARDSINTAWRNASFRGYADYMQTEEFARAVDELIAAGTDKRVAIMCAEAVPWRCHRALVSDALLVRGAEVVDIIAAKSSKPHTLTRFARVVGRSITYPADEG